MKTRTVRILIALVVASFFAGRFSAPEKVKIETRTVTVEAEKTNDEDNSETTKTVTAIHKPDGTILTRTKDKIVHNKKSETEKEIKQVSSVTKEVTIRRGVVVSLLAGASLPLSQQFGASVTKEILGPINLGVWVIPTNKSAGISLGLEF